MASQHAKTRYTFSGIIIGNIVTKSVNNQNRREGTKNEFDSNIMERSMATSNIKHIVWIFFLFWISFSAEFYVNSNHMMDDLMQYAFSFHARYSVNNMQSTWMNISKISRIENK